VLCYDLAGAWNGHPGPGGGAEPLNEVTYADVGRLVIIGAGLHSGDVPVLLGGASPAIFDAVPATARLEEWVPGGSLDATATALYDEFRRDGIGGAKRSKLLHVKRPWLVPIYDTRVGRVYKQCVDELTVAIEDPGAAWWEAPKRDLVDGAGEFVWLAASLATDDDAIVRRVARLSALRLLDILAWTLAEGRGT
jgi:Family of unknown function (DUF6308)